MRLRSVLLHRNNIQQYSSLDLQQAISISGSMGGHPTHQSIKCFWHFSKPYLKIKQRFLLQSHYHLTLMLLLTDMLPLNDLHLKENNQFRNVFLQFQYLTYLEHRKTTRFLRSNVSLIFRNIFVFNKGLKWLKVVHLDGVLTSLLWCWVIRSITLNCAVHIFIWHKSCDTQTNPKPYLNSDSLTFVAKLDFVQKCIILKQYCGQQFAIYWHFQESPIL